MITFTEITKKERTLNTPEDIVAHLGDQLALRADKAPLKAGDKVRLKRRDGVPPQFMVGDVGIVLLCDPDYSPLTTLLGINETGMTIQFPVATEILEKMS